jgi:hypothetical protein
MGGSATKTAVKPATTFLLLKSRASTLSPVFRVTGQLGFCIPYVQFFDSSSSRVLLRGQMFLQSLRGKMIEGTPAVFESLSYSFP